MGVGVFSRGGRRIDVFEGMLRNEEGLWNVSDMSDASTGPFTASSSGWFIVSKKSGFTAFLCEYQGSQSSSGTGEGGSGINIK
jgi:hypothetical protein